MESADVASQLKRIVAGRVRVSGILDLHLHNGGHRPSRTRSGPLGVPARCAASGMAKIGSAVRPAQCKAGLYLCPQIGVGVGDAGTSTPVPSWP